MNDFWFIADIVLDERFVRGFACSLETFRQRDQLALCTFLFFNKSSIKRVMHMSIYRFTTCAQPLPTR